MNNKILKMAAVFSAGCILLTGCQKADAESVKRVTVSEYTKNDLEKTLIVKGVVESSEKDSVITTNLTECKVTALHFNVGDYVQEGDIVCELDRTEILEEIEKQKKKISDAAALSEREYKNYQEELSKTRQEGNLTLEEARRYIDDAREEYENARINYENGIGAYNASVSKAEELKQQIENTQTEEEKLTLAEALDEINEQMIQTKLAYESAEAEMRVKEAEIEQYEKNYESTKLKVDSYIREAQYDIDMYNIQKNSSDENQKTLDELNKQLEETKIKAQRSGIISNVNAEVGKKCSDGIIMNIQSTSGICVHTVIDESDLLSVEDGMRADVKIKARPGEIFSGKVDRVIDIKTQDGFDGYIAVDDTEDFRVGMSATIEIYTIDQKDVLSVKNSAVVTEDDEETYVYKAVKQDDGTYKIKKVKVETGIKTLKFTEIKGVELSEGELIVLSPSTCSEGEIVEAEIVKEKSEEGEE